MSEHHESGNRWEQPAEPSDVDPTAAAPDLPASGAPAADVPAAGAPKASRMPGWMTTRGLIATGAAAAIFLGGGGIGYAVGVHGHHDANQNFPARFDLNGVGPGSGQPPGGGRPPGFQQGPPSQYQSNGSGSGSSSPGSSS